MQLDAEQMEQLGHTYQLHGDEDNQNIVVQIIQDDTTIVEQDTTVTEQE